MGARHIPKISSGGGGGGPNPPPGSQARYYDIIVGNAPAGDTAAICDFLDTGNGMQWKAALAAAAAANPVKSVFTRRGVYDLGAAGSDGLPITVPAGVLNQCDGEGSTAIVASADPATTGTLQALVVQGFIRDVTVLVPDVTTVNPGNDVSFVLVTDSGDARDLMLRVLGQTVGFAANWGATNIGILQLATAGGQTRVERAFVAGMPSRLIDGDPVPSFAYEVTGDPTGQVSRLVDLQIESGESDTPPTVPDIGLELFNTKHLRVSRPTIPGARTVGIRAHGEGDTVSDVEIEGLDVRWLVTAPVQRRGVQLLSEAGGVVDGVKILSGFIDCFNDNGKGCIGIDIHSTGANSVTENCEVEGCDPHNFAEAAHVESVAAGLVDANGIVNSRVGDNTAGINNVNDVNFRALGDW